MTKYSEFADLLEYLASCIRTWEAEKNARMFRDLESSEEPDEADDSYQTTSSEPKRTHNRNHISLRALKNNLGLKRSKLVESYIRDHNIPIESCQGGKKYVDVKYKAQILAGVRKKYL